MKIIYSRFQVLCLTIFLLFIVSTSGFAQCINQGSLTDPPCGSGNTTTTQANVGGKQEWDLNNTNGADYTVSISAGSNGCGTYSLSTTSFTGTGAAVAENIYAGGSCCWAASGTSATLTYTRIHYTNTTSTTNLCVGSGRGLTVSPTPLTYGTWSVVGGTGSGTLSGPANATTFTATSAGTVTIRYTQGGCSSDAAFTIDAAPTTATVGANQSVCALSTTLTGNNPTTGTGTWTQTGGPVGGTTIFSNPNAYNSTATANKYGTYTYQWSIANGTCTASTATITVTFSQTPTTASTGPTKNICGSLVSGGLGGNTALVGTGTWTQTSGPAGSSTTFSNPNLGNASATANIYGTYIYTWTIANGACTSSQASVTVNYYATPTTATAGGPQNICGSLSSASLGGNTPTVGSGAWSQTSGPPGGNTTFLSSASSPNASATVSVYGTYQYTWTISNGTCAPSTATVTVNYYQTPTTASPVASQDVCGSLTSGSLQGNVITAGTGTWAQVSGPGTSVFSNVNDESSTVTVSQTGTYVFSWTVTNGTCPSNSANETVNFYAAPTQATAGPQQYICGPPLTSAALGGNTPVSGTGSWSQLSGPGPTFFSSTTDPNATASVSAQGQYIYVWTITNGVCSTTANDTVNFYSPPTTATVGPTQNICGTLTSNSLGGNFPIANGTGAWSQVSGPGSSSFSAPTFGTSTATVSIEGSYTFRFTISNGTCTPSSADIVVNYVATPAGGTIANVSFCSSANTGTVSVTGVTNATQYAWALPAGLSGSSTTSTITVGGNVPGSYTVTVTPSDVALGVTCTGTPVTGLVTILSQPVIDSVNQGTLSCFGGSNDTINVYAHTGNGSLFYSVDGGTTYTNTTGQFPGLSAGTYNISVKDDSACATTYGANPVKILPPPAILLSIASYGNVKCNGDSSGYIDLSASGGTGSLSFLWNNGATSQNISHLEAGTFTVTATDGNGCTNTISQALTEPSPLTATVSSTNVSCYGANDGTASVVAGGGSPAYTYLWSTGDVTTTITNLNGAVYFVTVTDNSACKAVGSVNILNPLPLAVSLTVSNVSCFNSGNGGITANVTGGTGTYTYTWSPNVSTTNTVNAGPGTYHLTVTDINNCSVVDSATVTQPLSQLSVTSIVTPVGCTGDTNGVIQLLPSGGVGGYTYNWATGQTIQIISGLGAGTYAATVTDGNGCQATISNTLNAPTPIVSSITTTNVTCYGAHNGTANLTVSGGVAPYSVLWSNFDTTFNITRLGNGIIKVIIQDAYGCRHEDSTKIKRPALLTGNLVVSNIKCYGSNVDTITVFATGGNNGGYTYTWSPAVSTDSTVTNVGPGQYNVTVTDSKGCTFTDSTVLTQPLAPLFVSDIVTPVKCNGASNGSIDLQPTGGVGGYTYSWLSGQITQVISGLSAGTYTATVTDANGCQATLTETLTDPAVLTTVITGTSATCSGAGGGTATVTASGGVAPYTYLWSDLETTATISNLSGGKYGVIVTDANGCQHNDTVTITQPQALSATFTTTNINCNGAANGTITVNVTGGTGTYSYAWTPNVSTTNTVTNAGPGTYVVTVTDANLCTLVDSTTLTQPAAAVAVTATVTPITCNGAANGAISLSVSGGTGSYTYAWTGTIATTPVISGLSAGTYTATVTDANGCTASAGGTLTDPAAIISSVTGTDVSCAGAADGTATVATVSGGTGPYTYLWSNFDNTQTATGFGPGWARVIISDANGCQHRDSVLITQPQPLVLTLSSTNINCTGAANGTVTANVTGGTGAYSYAWTPNVSNTNTVSNAGPGTYAVTVTDGHGCVASDSTTLTQPQALRDVFSVSNVLCYGDSNGSVTVVPIGGTGTFTYAWSPVAGSTATLSNLKAGTYFVTITDLGGCTLADSVHVLQPSSPIVVTTVIHNVSCYGGNDGSILVIGSGGSGSYTYLWSNGDTTQYISGLTAFHAPFSPPLSGIYTVTITDANGCTASYTDTITAPAILAASIAGTDVSCPGQSNGTATLTVTGGTPAYSYLWSNISTTQNQTNLPGGLYTVIVTDAKGCKVTDTIRIHEAAPIVITLATTNVNCFGANNGSITASVTGGTGTYSYAWTPNVSNTATVTNAAPGKYVVTVTDGSGCSNTDSTTITQSASAIAVVAAVTDITCNGAANGAISLSVSGGTGSYTYAWTGSPAHTPAISSLSPGTYTATVTDANGCTASPAGTTLTDPLPISSTTSGTNVTCAGAANGTATVVTVTGGTGPYTYLWSNFANTQTAGGFSGGWARVIITDAHGCEHRDSVLLTEPAALTATLTSTNVHCIGGNDGTITVSASGGTGAYSYAWSPNVSTGPTVTGASPGTYVVTVSDVNSCKFVDSVKITQPSSGLLVQSSVSNSGCGGTANGSISLSVSGGTPAYTFVWSNGQHTQVISNLSAGMDTVTVSDANGCSVVVIDTVKIGAPIQATTSSTGVSCAGNKNGTATVTVTSGGVAPFSYLWSNFKATATIDSLSGGWYYVIITDANGCQTRDSTYVSEPLPFSVALNVTPISCNNTNDGSITVVSTGGAGTPSYSWSPTEPNAGTISALTQGTYAVTVTDGNNCTAAGSATLVNPAPLSVASVVINPKCNGANNGTVTLIVNGGSPQYNYTWTGALAGSGQSAVNVAPGTYYVTVTDAHNCTATDSATVIAPLALYISGRHTDVTCAGNANGYAIAYAYNGTTPYSYQWSGVSGPITIDYPQLSGGTYFVTVTDFNNCTASWQTTIREPDSLKIALVGTDLTCNGVSNGAVVAHVTGGTPQYRYLWNNYVTDSSLTNLAAGTYGLVVTDSNGCTANKATTLVQPTALNVNVAATNPSCSGSSTGSIALTVSGGTGTPTFNWSTTPAQTTSTATNLAAGTYYVTVSDANSCAHVDSATLVAPQVLIVNTAISNPTCADGNNGFISLDVHQGTAPYRYDWSTTPAQNGNVASGLVAGQYIATITDAAGCQLFDTATVVAPLPIVITVGSLGNSTCINSADGYAVVSVTGGLAPYTYQVGSLAQVSDTFRGLLPGNYALTVKDANGCSSVTSWTVAVSSAFTVQLSVDHTIILAGDTIHLTATTVSDTTVTGYAWGLLDSLSFTGCANAANCPSPSAAPTSSHIYTVVATNARGCTATDTVSVAVSNQPSAFLPSAFTPNGDGNNDRFEFDILGARTLDVQIWNRWGEKVFSDPNQLNGVHQGGSNGWDGSFRGNGVEFDSYTYQINVTYNDGHQQMFAGTVTVMR